VSLGKLKQLLLSACISKLLSVWLGKFYLQASTNVAQDVLQTEKQIR
jgi:hypothetical protein